MRRRGGSSVLVNIAALLVIVVIGVPLVTCCVISGGITEAITETSSRGRASTARRDATEEPAPQPIALKIKQLKTIAITDHSGTMEFRLTNTSDVFLQHWAVDFEFYDAAGEYMGKAETMVSNLRPGENRVAEAYLTNIALADIAKYSAKLGGVVGKSGLRIDSGFTVEIGD